MSTLVVIPCCGRTNSEIEAETGAAYPAFINLAGKPLYAHIVDRVNVDGNLPVHVRLVVPYDSPKLDIAEGLASGGLLSVVRCRFSSSIGQTLLAALNGSEEYETLIVNMADTLIEFPEVALKDIVYTSKQGDLYKWTTIETTPDRSFVFPDDRSTVFSVEQPRDVCIGVFIFSSIELIRNELIVATSTQHGDVNKEPFFIAVEKYSMKKKMNFEPMDSWLDFGHIDSYYESKIKYQNIRYFNSLEYDRKRGVVTKRSKRVEQFRHQVRWYRQLPDELNAFIPHIYESSDGVEPFISMEMLSIPTLSELFITRRMHIGAWNGVARAIKEILNRFQTYSISSSLTAGILRSVYFDKTFERITTYLESVPEASDWWVPCGRGQLTIIDVMKQLEEFIEKYELTAHRNLTPIHGDFCFSNILFDPKSLNAKMIDPRGEFGVPGIYGDSLYDLAKLSHSYYGGYEYIISDRFSVIIRNDGMIDLSIPISEYDEQVATVFKHWLAADTRIDRKVRAIETLLFLSMLPLHGDTPIRQKAMLANGLKKFAELQSENLL